MITCTNCGRDNEDEYKYCLGCGSVLPKPEEQASKPAEPEMIDCPHCGTKVPSNFKFCGACGGAIAARPPMTTDAPSQSPVAQESSSDAPPTQKSAATNARLVVIKPDGTEGASIPLQGGSLELGRSSDYEALSSDPFLSPVHAKLEAQSDGFLVSDAGSLNGVFLRISSEVELSDGDHIRIGQELLEYREMDGYESEAKAPDGKTLSGGSPDNGNWGRLGLIAGPDLETRGFVFSSDEVMLGREIGDIVFRDDGFVSGKHARIAKVEGKVFLKDLGSSNGTYIRIRKPRTIRDGDLILMGQQLFRLET